MADRVPWPRKTGGTWGPTTHSTCSPPFLVHSRVSRCDVIGAKHTRGIVSPRSSMEALPDSCHRHVARPENLTDRPRRRGAHFLSCHHTFKLRGATVRLPLSERLATPCTPCRMLCATRVGIRFNDALAIWQLMGCVTDPSDASPTSRSAPFPCSPGTVHGSPRGDRLASGRPPFPRGRGRPAPSGRRGARYARHCTVIYFFG